MLLADALQNIISKNDFYSILRGDALSYTQQQILNFLAEITYEEIIGAAESDAEKRLKTHISLLNSINDHHSTDTLKKGIITMTHLLNICKRIDEMYPHRKLEYINFN